MTKQFEFKNNDLELDIAGNKFYLDTTEPSLIERILEFAHGAEAMGNDLKGKEDYVEGLKEAIAFCLEAIDSILGEGSSDKIFEGRKVGMFDCLDVMSYIVDSVNENKDNKFLAYSPNRAQRRAK